MDDASLRPGAVEASVWPRHGALEPRGVERVPRSQLYTGRFGRMFRRLPPFEPGDADLKALADAMTANAALLTPSRVPAGYTYLGQFIDHDITFDPNSKLQRD